MLIKINKTETNKNKQEKYQNETGVVRETLWQKIGRTCLYLLIFFNFFVFLPFTIAPVEINKQVFAGILVLIAFISYLIHSQSPLSEEFNKFGNRYSFIVLGT